MDKPGAARSGFRNPPTWSEPGAECIGELRAGQAAPELRPVPQQHPRLKPNSPQPRGRFYSAGFSGSVLGKESPIAFLEGSDVPGISPFGVGRPQRSMTL